MLPVGWLVVAVLVAVLLSMWVTFTLTRLDRLHARVDAAQAALDAQLVRRAAALQHVAEAPDSGLPDERRAALDALAGTALAGGPPAERQAVENAVGRAVLELADGDNTIASAAAAELREAAARVQVARRFYNDAVRDTRSLRARRMPRLLRLAGHVRMPQFFDIDDTVPPQAPTSPPSAAGPRTVTYRSSPAMQRIGNEPPSPSRFRRRGLRGCRHAVGLQRQWQRRQGDDPAIGVDGFRSACVDRPERELGRRRRR